MAALSERASLRDQFLAWRDRLIARPWFQRFAVAFPPTRALANTRARQLFDLTAGFVYSQILAVAVELRLFHVLAEGPASAEALGLRFGLSRGEVERLLEACVGLGLAARRSNGRYGLGQLGAALNGNPGVEAMIAHHAMLYRDLQDPLALMRDPAAETELGRYWAYVRGQGAELAAGEVAAYSTLMAASQQFIAEEVLDAYSMRRHRHLLELGGGEGAFAIAAARRAPELHVTLFDLPAVAARAEMRFAEAGLSDRARGIGGDFLADPLPEGADAISLVRVLYDHGDETVASILRAAHAALPPGGRLIVAEPMAGTPGAEPVGAYFAFYLLAMRSGRVRSAETLSSMIRAAGFARVRPLSNRRPLLARVIVAER
ncbi:MAG: methyltransferase [Pseudomonadota bacterium]